MSDMMDRMSGKAKEITGKVTSNRRLELKGKFQHDAAVLRHKARRSADEVSDTF